MERLILDTGVLIDVARERLKEPAVAADDDVALPAVAIAEFMAGVLLDPSPARQAAQRQFLDDILAAVPIIPYDAQVAERHAELLAHTARAGRPRGTHDLLIAATALAAGRTILTTDAEAAFDGLPGVTARLITV